MQKGPLVVAVSLSLMIGVALAPTAGAFGGRGGRAGGGAFGGRPSGFHQPGFTGRSGFNGFHPGFNGFKSGFSPGYNRAFPGLDGFNPGFNGFPGFKSFNRGFGGNAGFGSFVPWGGTVWAAPSYFGYGPSAYYPPPPTYYAEYTAPYAPGYASPMPYAPGYASPMPYGPPVGGSVSVVPAPQTPSVVWLPGGRYELRGDGVTAPYQWVWIPDPPPVPPAPPTAPPAVPRNAPGEQPPSADAPPARRSQLYRWTDAEGVVHWTNRAEAVPAKYRSQAKHDPAS